MYLQANNGAYTTDPPRVRYGRITEVGGNAPVPRPWRSFPVDAGASDFRFTSNNRHEIVDVGLARLFERLDNRIEVHFERFVMMQDRRDLTIDME